MNLQQAEKVVERAANTDKVLGVFVLFGKTKVTAVTTDLFAQAMRDARATLVGCYSGEADPSWIVEDVRHCGGAA